YAFAYRLTRNRFAASVAALTFTFGGYLTSYPAQQPTILESAVWLPLVLLCLDSAAELYLTPGPSPARRGVTLLIIAGAAMAMSILAGHPQTWLYVLYAALAYWLMANRRWLMDERNTHHASRISSFILQTSAFLLFAFGLSAMQLLPTLEFTRLSTRAALGYAFTSSGFALHEIITLLLPGYFGGSPLYVGIVPLMLAGAALWSVNREPSTANGARPFTVHRSLSSKRCFSITVFWLLLALVALFLSFGDASFVYSLFYLLAPGFAQVRDQERAALLWSFALAMLAAIGAARISERLAVNSERSAMNSQFRITVHRSLLTVHLFLLVLIALAYVSALASEAAQV
ncbi:MAG: hypothetical protein LC737_11590, partial [Chloroflexi bacterium]|nr:hypothetical protein [Chloroflexota bacterium]